MAFDILMYHSIACSGGPTSIDPQVFAGQLEAVEASGRSVVSLDQIHDAMTGKRTVPDGALALTFDDGFQDFADVAWPLIKSRGWPVTVFVPTDRLGGVENWYGAQNPPRHLMGWDRVVDLHREGVEFGGHSLGHPDLTTLDDETLKREVAGPKSTLAEKLGHLPRHFAPPYGRSDERVRAHIAQHWETSCGTRFDRVGGREDIYELPRIEMFYFTNPVRWKQHLAGQGRSYLKLRQTMRNMRQFIQENRVTTVWRKPGNAS